MTKKGYTRRHLEALKAAGTDAKKNALINRVYQDGFEDGANEGGEIGEPGAKKTWYEVYESTAAGTRTVKICATLKKARALRHGEQVKADADKKNFYIDEWRNLDSPENLGARE